MSNKRAAMLQTVILLFLKTKHDLIRLFSFPNMTESGSVNRVHDLASILPHETELLCRCPKSSLTSLLRQRIPFTVIVKTD